MSDDPQVHDYPTESDLASRCVTVSSQPAKDPETFEEATAFNNGYKAGVTAYACAIGHSGLKSNNEVLAKLLNEQGWKTIELFEKITGRSL